MVLRVCDGWAEDWMYLVAALNAGSTVVVSCPAARASLHRAGLMEPAQKVRGRWGRPEPFMMALTKNGKLRAEQLSREQATRPFLRHMRKLRNGAVNRNSGSVRRDLFMAGFYGPGRF